MSVVDWCVHRGDDDDSDGGDGNGVRTAAAGTMNVMAAM